MTIFELNILWITISPTYYWLMYALSFVLWYYFLVKISWLKKDDIDNMFIYIILWVVLGWRLWYILFYNFDYYINNITDIIKVWEWWMSFHWWLVWVIIAIFLYSKKYKKNFFEISDYLALVAPIWLFFWRIWNYINKELLWYPGYEWFLAVYKNGVWYFPSSLLEALFEWLLLFFIINYIYYKNKDKFNYWFISWFFLVFYWLSRVLIEIFFRQPDSHIWYILGVFTMWELLSFPMIVIGIILLYKNKHV